MLPKIPAKTVAKLNKTPNKKLKKIKIKNTQQKVAIKTDTNKTTRLDSIKYPSLDCSWDKIPKIITHIFDPYTNYSLTLDKFNAMYKLILDTLDGTHSELNTSFYFEFFPNTKDCLHVREISRDWFRNEANALGIKSYKPDTKIDAINKTTDTKISQVINKSPYFPSLDSDWKTIKQHISLLEDPVCSSRIDIESFTVSYGKILDTLDAKTSDSQVSFFFERSHCNNDLLVFKSEKARELFREEAENLKLIPSFKEISEGESKKSKEKRKKKEKDAKKKKLEAKTKKDSDIISTKNDTSKNDTSKELDSVKKVSSDLTRQRRESDLKRLKQQYENENEKSEKKMKIKKKIDNLLLILR